MLIQRLSLYSAILLIAGPIVATAHPLFGDKRSNLPCLVGQPGFSEHLIEHNPWISGKTYLLSDSFLGFSMVGVKIPTGSHSLHEMKQVSFPTFSRWEESVNYISTKVRSASQPIVILEGAFYLNRFAVAYVSSPKKSGALVIGNADQPFNYHVSLGHFPVHFGSGFSEYPLASPLQADLGATANVPALAVNVGYRWNLKHETKLRIFGFIGDLIVSPEDKEKTRSGVKEPKEERRRRNLQVKEEIIKGGGKELGFNIHHEWTPDFVGVSAGVSGVSTLPISAKGGAKTREMLQSGGDAYMHLTLGSVKIKTEWLVGIPREEVKSRFRRKKNKNAPLVESYAGHAEIAYRLPFKRESSAVIGYTRGVSQLLTTPQRVFLGVKTSLAENLHCILGYQCEPAVNTKGKSEYFSSDSKNSLTIQFSYTV